MRISFPRSWPLRLLLAGGLMFPLLGILYVYHPAETRIFPPCPFLFATGLYCPGCGSLRATHSLLNFQIGQAFAFNPLLVISLPFLFALIVVPRWTHRRWVPWVSFTILIVYGILRNIPVWPFSWLAPG